jgi:hypothetical protein
MVKKEVYLMEDQYYLIMTKVYIPISHNLHVDIEQISYFPF